MKFSGTSLYGFLTSRSMQIAYGIAGVLVLGKLAYDYTRQPPSVGGKDAFPPAAASATSSVEDDKFAKAKIDMKDCGEVFQAAVLASRSKSIRLSLADKAILYGLYKCAVVGPCQLPEPSRLDMFEHGKWKAWHDVGALSKSDAEAKYVEAWKKVNPKWKAPEVGGGGKAAVGNEETDEADENDTPSSSSSSTGIDRTSSRPIETLLSDAEVSSSRRPFSAISQPAPAASSLDAGTENTAVAAAAAVSSSRHRVFSQDEIDRLVLLCRGSLEDAREAHSLDKSIPPTLASRLGLSSREVPSCLQQLGAWFLLLRREEEEEAEKERRARLGSSLAESASATAAVSADSPENSTSDGDKPLSSSSFITALVNLPLTGAGETCLHIAADAGSTEIAETLLAAGSNVDAVEGESGSTPLHYAVMSGSLAFVQLLLSKGASTDVRDGEGHTPVDLLDGTTGAGDEAAAAIKALLENPPIAA